MTAPPIAEVVKRNMDEVRLRIEALDALFVMNSWREAVGDDPLTLREFLEETNVSRPDLDLDQYMFLIEGESDDDSEYKCRTCSGS